MPFANKSIALIAVSVGFLVLLAAPASANPLRVGWNVDIHMNKHFDSNDPNQDYANDFHIWGIIESGDPEGNNPPTLLDDVNFQTTGPDGVPPWQKVSGGLWLETFTYQIGNPVNRALPVNSPWPDSNNPPQAPFYYFEGNWSTTGQIPYCTWMHFGLMFGEECHNIGYWLQGVWTKNGVDPNGSPIYGFEVRDGIGPSEPPEPQKIRIQNASGIETMPLAMQMMVLTEEEGRAFPLEDLNTDFFDTHPEWNMRWVNVPTSMLPTTMNGIDSFFDVYLEDIGLTLGPEQFLLAREHSQYYQSNPGWEDFWQYEIHEAHMPEPVTLAMMALGGLLLLRRRRA